MAFSMVVLLKIDVTARKWPKNGLVMQMVKQFFALNDKKVTDFEIEGKKIGVNGFGDEFFNLFHLLITRIITRIFYHGTNKVFL